MNPTMPSQRARVAEGLFISWLVIDARLLGYQIAYLSASFTHVRLLSSVYSLVNGKSGTLDELFAAVWIVADMWPHSGVDAL